MDSEKIIEITPDNIYETGVLCGSEVQFKEGKIKKLNGIKNATKKDFE
ncbi:hypothetical protein [Clostridium chromiireducens]|uniref:Uncharacterized protein n=1 Tax=Clostridium chromiireducens TaxID=225345 RepID=A0A1V4IJU8_9CLOT|nr:hypothetical protein [Clostridium chromiireducens]OPJ60281.1 hypothetical protein CLCHR_30460 [Clostridium chromiireducens]